jgi:hypothetical protein
MLTCRAWQTWLCKPFKGRTCSSRLWLDWEGRASMIKSLELDQARQAALKSFVQVIANNVESTIYFESMCVYSALSKLLLTPKTKDWSPDSNSLIPGGSRTSMWSLYLASSLDMKKWVWWNVRIRCKCWCKSLLDNIKSLWWDASNQMKPLTITAMACTSSSRLLRRALRYNEGVLFRVRGCCHWHGGVVGIS